MKFSFLLCFALAFSSFLAAQNQEAPARKPQVYVYKETARPKAKIKADYPYDIALATAAGDTLNSTDVLAVNGKPTVILFWLTTCAPCRRELAAYASKFEQWQKEADFNLYAISIDFPKNRKNFEKMVNEKAWPFPTYLDLNREFRLIMPGSLNGLPQLFVLDANGKIIHHKRKYLPGDEDKLFAFLKSLSVEGLRN